jgi:hypothetical protein
MRKQGHAAEDPTTWWARTQTALRRPLVFALVGVMLIGLLALMYLNEVAGVALANDRLSALRTEQARLRRQDALLHAQLGQVTSPAYIDQRARALGLAPASVDAPVRIVVSHPHGTSGGPR